MIKIYLILLLYTSNIQEISQDITIEQYTVTAYCVEQYPHICGGNGYTYSSTKVTPNRSVAVDKTVIPLGTTIYIENYGYRIAEDTGSGITEKHIDVAVETHSEALAFGKQILNVIIVDK